jgi:hypothetical protein
LLVCGIAASLLYIATTIVAAMLWKGYSSASQTVSELFAIGAPSRPLVVPLFLAYSVLMIAFGLGVWRSAGQKRALRVIGGLLVGREVLGVVGTLFAPMHLRGAEGSLTDAAHAMITGVGVLLYLLIIGFGAAAFGKRFRLYSIGTLLVLVVFGTVAGLDGPRLAADLPTPWMGVWERINIYATMLWIMVLTIALLRTPVEQSQASLDGRPDSGWVEADRPTSRPTAA